MHSPSNIAPFETLSIPQFSGGKLQKPVLHAVLTSAILLYTSTISPTVWAERAVVPLESQRPLWPVEAVQTGDAGRAGVARGAGLTLGTDDAKRKF